MIITYIIDHLIVGYLPESTCWRYHWISVPCPSTPRRVVWRKRESTALPTELLPPHTVTNGRHSFAAEPHGSHHSLDLTCYVFKMV